MAVLLTADDEAFLEPAIMTGILRRSSKYTVYPSYASYRIERKNNVLFYHRVEPHG